LALEQFSGTVVAVPDLTDQVYSALRDAILSGTFAPGEHLPTPVVARKLGVSGSPVREALRQLAGEGLIQLEPGRGATVTVPSAAYIREVFLLRNPLEAVAARLAAERISAEQLAELCRIEAGGEAAGTAGDAPQFHVCSDQFHAAIYEAAGSPLLARTLTNLKGTLIIFRNANPQIVSDPFLVHRQHAALLETFARHDGAAAEAAMADHLCAVEKDWLATAHCGSEENGAVGDG
jgi:DNA-binding GntR family transcriptional regulator